MAKKRPQVALVYDFDGTLSPGNMQEFGFIQATGKTKDEFSKPLFLRKRGCNRTLLACSEPLRSKVVGPSEGSPYFGGWDGMGEGSL